METESEQKRMDPETGEAWLIHLVWICPVLIAIAVAPALLNLPAWVVAVQQVLLACVMGGVLLTLITWDGFALFRLKKRILEVLATIFFGAAVMSLIVHFSGRPPTSWRQHPEELLIPFACCMARAFGGSAWAWHRIRRLEMDDTRQRLWMLCKGWMAIAGLVAALGVPMMAVGMIIECFIAKSGNSSDLGTFLLAILCSAMLSLLSLPAINVERELARRKA